MKHCYYILLILFLCFISCLSLPAWVGNFLEDFFIIKQVQILQLFTCSHHDATHLIKSTNLFWFKTNHNVSWEDYRQGTFIDADCEINRKLLSQESVYQTSQSVMVWSNTLDWTEVELPLRYDSDVVQVRPETNGSVLLQYLEYTAKDIPLHIMETDTWDVVTRFVKEIHRKIDLKGATLDGAVVINELNPSSEEELRTMLLDDTEKRMDIMAKLNYALWHIIEHRFNFRIQLKKTDSYGYQTENGSFNGEIGMLIRNEAELGISSIRALLKRSDYVDFVSPTWLFRSSMLFLHPKVQGVRSALVQPFTYTLWITIFVTGLIVTVLLKITSRLESRSNQKVEEVEDSWAFSLIVTISAICDQGSDMVHSWITWRITFFTFLMFALLLNSFYSAAVVSFLLQPPTKTIRTAKDLTASNLKVAMTTISYNMDFFKGSDVPAIQELFHKKIYPRTQFSPNEFPTEVAFKKLKDENYAIHTESITLYPDMEKTFTQQQRCALTEIDLFPSTMIFVTARKRSQYIDILRQGFNRLREHGIQHYETLKWRPHKPTCTEQDELNNVDLETVSLAFIILLIGIVLSLAFLSLERLQHSLYCGRYRLNDARPCL